MPLPNVSYEAIKQVCRAKGLNFFETGDFNVNLVGIRNMRDLQANTFNDVFCIAFKKEGESVLLQYPCTTDPGTYYRLNPINVNGTAILPAGQYFGLWKIGMHQGKYEALVQRLPTVVIRDNNRDANLDLKARTGASEFIGLNCHRASPTGTSKQVDKWSAGCQVLANNADFDQLMKLVKYAAKHYGNSFTYTLLESTDFE
jgi:hypothetical protein